MKIYGAKAFVPELKGLIRHIRPFWTCEEVGAEYDYVLLDPEKKENFGPDNLKVNPFGKVPSLVDDDGFQVFESVAICEYIATKFKKLQPAYGTHDWFLHQQWLLNAVTSVEPMMFQIAGADVFMDDGPGKDAVRNRGVNGLTRLLPPLNAHLANRPYLMGDEFMLADILMGCCLTYPKRIGMLKEYRVLDAYVGALLARPAYVRALEKSVTPKT